MLALTYDDIQLIPEFSCIDHRENVSLKTTLIKGMTDLEIPIIASPMDTVCECEMYAALYSEGGTGCIHRFMTIEEQVKQIEKMYGFISGMNEPIIAAIGATGDYLNRASAVIEAGANVLLIDVAHGHHINVGNAIEKLKYLFPDISIIAGNIATAQAAKYLEDYGADALRVGIGGGSLCTTRIKTGFGVPNVTCLENVRQATTLPIIADGGIRCSADIAKALAVGANVVMLGSLLAGTPESPGQIISKNGTYYKTFRGSASFETKSTHKLSTQNIEGESTIIPFKTNVRTIIRELMDGVRSALSYAGANNLSEFHPDYYQVTNNGLIEGKPHLIYK